MGLREALELSTAEIAEALGIDEATYIRYESGTTDIPMSILHALAHEYHIELTALLFDEDPHMKSYYVTRRGRGQKVERTKAYSYQSLAAGFAGRSVEPYLVTVYPGRDPERPNTHAGQEFDYVLEGRMEITIGANRMVLEEGDSIMFDPRRPHRIRALDDKIMRFICIID